MVATLERELSLKGESWSPALLDAVRRLSAHVASGSATSEAAFLATLDPQVAPEFACLIRVLGTPDAFGLLDQDPQMLFAGAGLLQYGTRQVWPSHFLDGFALYRSALARITRIEMPRYGLRIVTRRELFHALRLTRIRWDRRMIVYADRYADAAVRGLAERAALLKTGIEVWADISLSGVLFVRSIAAAAKGRISTVRMTPRHLDRASEKVALTESETIAIQSNLAAEPEALLADTLRAICARNLWAPARP